MRRRVTCSVTEMVIVDHNERSGQETKDRRQDQAGNTGCVEP